MSIGIAARENTRVESDNSFSALLTFIPIVTPILIGTYWLSTYLDQRATERVEKQFEARKPYTAQQASLYLETTVLIGELATRPRTEVAWQNNDRRFSVLLWSELPAYESQSVRDEMTNVSKKIESYRSSAKEADIARSRTELQEAATVLSTIMGDDLKANMTLK